MSTVLDTFMVMIGAFMLTVFWGVNAFMVMIGAFMLTLGVLVLADKYL